MSDAFPSNYLKAADLGGRAHLLTIDQVSQEELGKDVKPVVYFQGKDKGLVLNKTNGMTIASKYGDETDHWKDCEIEVYPDKTQFQGQMVDCIRVRIPVPRADENEDDIPF